MEHPDFDGRAYAIAAGSRKVLEQAGLWDALPSRPGRSCDIRVSDGQVGRPASKLYLHFDSREVATEADPARRRGVRLDGRGAQPAHGHQRAAARS